MRFGEGKMALETTMLSHCMMRFGEGKMVLKAPMLLSVFRR
jgi:hypothetical protein